MSSDARWKLLCIVKLSNAIFVLIIGLHFADARRHQHYPTYQCYVCTYFADSKDEWSRKECIEHPQQLGTIPCNISSYCFYQEMYDPVTDEITSFVRSCLREPSKNTCIQDYTRITCEYTCQGDYCNRNDTGHQHEVFLKGGARPNSVYSVYIYAFIMTYLFMHLAVKVTI